MTHELRIYQLPKGVDYKFYPFSEAAKHDLLPNDYNLVYKNRFVTDLENPHDILDSIYDKFQDEHPSYMHNVSVSDVVVLDGIPYYVDVVGWISWMRFKERYA